MKRISKFTTFILLIMTLTVGLYYYFGSMNEHPDYKTMTPDYIIEAKDLYNQYKSETDAAQYKYGGRMLEITGEITSLEKIDSLTIAIYAFNEGDFGNEGIRCTFLTSEAEIINELSDIQGASIKGFCSGYNETDVIIEKCSLTKKQ